MFLTGRFDVVADRFNTERIIVRDGQLRRFQFSLASPTLAVLRDWLRQAGFADIASYDGDAGPVRFDSRRLIVVAQR